MQIKVLASSSESNCYIVTSKTSQIILECGAKISEIIKNLDFDKKIVCLVSHGTSNEKSMLSHLDHSRSQFEVSKFSEVFGKHNLKSGKQYTFLGEWKVLPVEMPHGNTTSFNFLIYNMIECKSIFFATDCIEIANIVDKPYDAFLIEANYDIDLVINKANSLEHNGWQNHLSKQYLIDWLLRRSNKAKNLVLLHLSNSGLIDRLSLTSAFDGLAERIFVAERNLEINI